MVVLNDLDFISDLDSAGLVGEHADELPIVQPDDDALAVCRVLRGDQGLDIDYGAVDIFVVDLEVKLFAVERQAYQREDGDADAGLFSAAEPERSFEPLSRFFAQEDSFLVALCV